MQLKFTAVGRLSNNIRRSFAYNATYLFRPFSKLSNMEGDEVVPNERVLLVFDFDHSLAAENSDLSVIKLAPNGKLPEEVSSLYSDGGWTKYMGEIFRYLHGIGKTPQDILSCMADIPLTDGMQQLLDFTETKDIFEHIIISDANSVFIEHILKQHKLLQLFKVFTNPAQFQDNGLLTLQKYHSQDWCNLSTDNLCKGHILQEFISERMKNGVLFHNVLYIGDGFNDLCPGLTLRSQDLLLPRAGFRLMKVLDQILEKDDPVPRSRLSASIKCWTDGREILHHVKNLSFVKDTLELL